VANLFFIHTPLQLLVAQQIINMEKLSDNIMLYGYVSGNSHFLKIYDLTCIDDYWSRKVQMVNVAQWASLSKSFFFRDLIRIYINYRVISKTISYFNVHRLFLGDMNNLSCKFSDLVFKKHNLEIAFFEEGTNHYAFRDRFNHTKKSKFYIKLFCKFLDALYFRPLYHIDFAKYIFIKDLRFEELLIDTRYSIIPFYKESFDKQIIVSNIFSKRLQKYLNEELTHLVHNKGILLMTTPAYELFVSMDDTIYLQVLREYLNNIPNDIMVYVKLHPRETGQYRENVLRAIGSSHKYCLLGEEFNIPVEYYLQSFSFVELVTFFSSTCMYNGYLFPKVRITSLLQYFIRQCKENGSYQLRNQFSDLINVEQNQEKNQNGYYICYNPEDSN
jgi:hypothetical protein